MERVRLDAYDDSCRKSSVRKQSVQVVQHPLADLL